MRIGGMLVMLAALLLGGCSGGGAGTAGSTGAGAGTGQAPFNLTVRQIEALAHEAYIYGYAPLEVARKEHDQTNPTASETVYAPVNELFIDTATNSPDSALWVSPNVNVLYSTVHMDLSDQPMLLYTPEVTDRYYTWEIMDAYTNAFAYIGSRATGGAERTFAFVGPDTDLGAFGSLPQGTQVIACPQNSVWAVVRVEVTPGDAQDLQTVISLVRQMVLLPYTEFLTRPPGYVNPLIQKPAQTVAALDTSGLLFFSVLNEWLTRNPPPGADDPVLASLAQIGVGPGRTTDFQALPVQQQQALLAGAQAASFQLAVESLLTGDLYNGWRYNLGSDFGNWGTNYLLRAMTARGGLGANVNAEAIYPLRLFGLPGESLYPDQRYTLTFPAGQVPQVIQPGFWSLTMYDRTTGRLVHNPIDRYSIGSQNSVTVAGDGSITFYIQRDDPGGDRTANWLPTAATGDNPFYMLFRAYHPDPVMFQPFDDPAYKLPNLQHVGP